jgi:uncharacterized membrane protein YgaE (UPF0421/DUF939 family)
MLKTGLSVTLSIYICLIFGLEHTVFAGVAAILAIQPSVYRSWKQLFDQIITNTLGASISLFFIYFVGDGPIIVGLIIVLMIALSIKLKMETTIPLTLVTVLAIMSASGSEDFYFALERFLAILIGTSTAIMINIIIFPPSYKKKFMQDVESTFQDLSLLMRTAISDEMKETSYQEINERLEKNVSKLEDTFKLFDEEREKLGKANQINTREFILFKQMLKVIQEGRHLLLNIEEHYVQRYTGLEENKLYDQQLEELIKYHEYLLLKYAGKIKADYQITENGSVIDKDRFYDQVIEFYEENKEQKLRNLIIASSIVDYSYHLERLDKLISQYLH